MLHHIGTVIPSSLGDFSKRIASATTAIADQLSLAVEDISGALPTSNNNNSTNPTEAVQEANTAFDPRVLELLSHARPGSSRPSSRLLKQSMLEYGSTPPRSAPLLVPGSPAFTRPWRCVLYLQRVSCGLAINFNQGVVHTFQWISVLLVLLL